MAHFGFLNIDKPPGVTSRWVVDQVQRLVRPDKAGHAGTLDPLATGVLMVAVGHATRLIEFVQRMTKRYRGTFLLGRSSDTEDTDGIVTELVTPPIPTPDAIAIAAAGMIGTIEQRPPAYSAVKIGGRRSYDLARAGKQVHLAARPVEIHKIEVVAYEYPQLMLDVECGSGTYVRTLGRELAERCGTSAVMSGLVRTSVGNFSVADAIGVDTLSADIIAASLLKPTEAIRHLPSFIASVQEIAQLRNGQLLLPALAPTENEVVAIDAHGNLVAILERRPNGLHPARVFPR